MHPTHYHCLLCGTDYALDEVAYVCPNHGAVGSLDLCYDYAALGPLDQPRADCGEPMAEHVALRAPGPCRGCPT